jgi:hypothetical protein
MRGELVKFPVKQRVLYQLGMDFDDRQAFLDAEIRRIDKALAVLKRRRVLVLNAYHREIDRKIAGDDDPDDAA